MRFDKMFNLMAAAAILVMMAGCQQSVNGYRPSASSISMSKAKKARQPQKLNAVSSNKIYYPKKQKKKDTVAQNN